MRRKNNPSLKRSYKTFHGKNPKEKTEQNFHVPQGFIKLGKAHAIEYVCNKRNGGGDGKTAIYRHKFKRGAIVCADERNKDQLYIFRKGIKITDAGIEG